MNLKLAITLWWEHKASRPKLLTGQSCLISHTSRQEMRWECLFTAVALSSWVLTPSDRTLCMRMSDPEQTRWRQSRESLIIHGSPFLSCSLVRGVNPLFLLSSHTFIFGSVEGTKSCSPTEDPNTKWCPLNYAKCSVFLPLTLTRFGCQLSCKTCCDAQNLLYF